MLLQSKRMLCGILVIKCPLNLGRFTGHLITNIPQSMRLLIITKGKLIRKFVHIPYIDDANVNDSVDTNV